MLDNNNPNIFADIVIDGITYHLTDTMPKNLMEALSASSVVLIYTDDLYNTIKVDLDLSDARMNETFKGVSFSNKKSKDLEPGTTDDSAVKIQQSKILKNIVPVSFPTLNGATFEGKVDTGADLCSLHVDYWKADEQANTVTFRIDAISHNNFTMHLERFQAIKTVSQEVMYRPVIRLNLIINDDIINDIEFNINDRTNMDHQVLIGNNLLNKGKFVVDPDYKERA